MTTDTPAQSVGSRIMTFTPTKEEFKDFSRYITYMESQGAHKAGMSKVSCISYIWSGYHNPSGLTYYLSVNLPVFPYHYKTLLQFSTAPCERELHPNDTQTRVRTHR